MTPTSDYCTRYSLLLFERFKDAHKEKKDIVLTRHEALYISNVLDSAAQQLRELEGTRPNVKEDYRR